MKQLPLIDGSLFVSPSFLDTLTCPRASEYYKLDQRTLSKNTNAVIFGSHIHTALNLFYRLQEYDLTLSDIKSRVVTTLELCFQKEPTDAEDFRSLSWAVDIFQRYADKYFYNSDELMRYTTPLKCKKCPEGGGECIWCNNSGLTSVMSEIPFAIKLFDYQRNTQPNIPVYFHGFIDLLVSRGKLLFPVDFKTSSKLGASYWDDKRAIAQPKGYAWALSQLLKRDIHGYIIHAVRTTPPPQYILKGKAKANGETKSLSDWWDETICDNRFDFGDGELEEWKENAIAQVKLFMSFYEKEFFPQNKTMCVRKYGNCDYFEVCHTFPVSDRPRILSSEPYKDKEQVKNLLK